MNYTIKSAVKIKDRSSDYGPMIDYMLIVQDNKNEQKSAELSQKQTTPAPVVGSTISGTIEDTKYGPKFRKDKPAYSGAGVAPRDPETQRYIMRQNALTAAINRGVCKVQELCKFAKDKKEVDKILDEELSGKHLVQVAGLLAKFSEGKITVVMEPEEVVKLMGYDIGEEATETAKTPPKTDETPKDEPMDDKDIEDIVDEIPF